MTQIERQADADDEAPQQTRQYQVLSPPAQTLFSHFILFGDSITQAACLDFQPALQASYIRRLDVLNRGFAGYTTAMACETLQHFLPVTTPAPTTTSCVPQIKLLTIFFGANDACLPEFPQHIPLSQFISNIRTIIDYPVFQRHQTKVILITTPPINEHQTLFPLQRTAQSAARYAAAVRSLAQDLHLPCVDIWRAFMQLSGYDPSTANPHGKLPGSIDLPPNPALATLLSDGIHFTPRGYEVLLAELMDVIKADVPDYLPENLPIIFREWRDVLNCPKMT